MGYNIARCDSGFLPASTFKIPNTLIGLETGILKDQNSIFKWKGEKRRLEAWEKDLTLREAFHVSCVPCYQELARSIGEERMKSYLKKFHYGNITVTAETIDNFWLEGNSTISQYQQIDFLKKLYDEKLPLSKTTMKEMKNIMVIKDTVNYKLSGKTGWAIRNNNNYGWFVGYLETNNQVYFVATNVTPQNQEMISDFTIARKAISLETFRFLKLIE